MAMSQRALSRFMDLSLWAERCVEDEVGNHGRGEPGQYAPSEVFRLSVAGLVEGASGAERFVAVADALEFVEGVLLDAEGVGYECHCPLIWANG